MGKNNVLQLEGISRKHKSSSDFISREKECNNIIYIIMWVIHTALKSSYIFHMYKLTTCLVQTLLCLWTSHLRQFWQYLIFIIFVSTDTDNNHASTAVLVFTHHWQTNTSIQHIYIRLHSIGCLLNGWNLENFEHFNITSRK